MRGKLANAKKHDATQGITPAGAGKTSIVHDTSYQRWDHPRRCGENTGSKLAKVRMPGSPPQVRGKPRDHPPLDDHIGITPAGAGKTPTAKAVHDALRITPAGAGKTCCCNVFYGFVQDHPRRCGENFCESLISILDEGSPPQVRGKLTGGTNFVRADRITPAGAGKTPRR